PSHISYHLPSAYIIPLLSTSSFFSFSLSYSFYPRDLHSFPTRRSSDLLVIDSLERPTQPVFPFFRRHQFNRGSSEVELVSAEERDRKSTRLNSSHGSISYAVFCLKKKKKQTKDIQDIHIITQHVIEQHR